MQKLLLGASIAALAALACSGAFAADGTAYLAQCKADIQSRPMPQGSPVTDAMRLALCQCIVDSGDQSVIDEAAALEKLPMQERFQKMQSASQKYKDTSMACRTKLNFPQRPPGGGPPPGATGAP